MPDSYGDVPPRASSLVESLRALGYSLPAAVADIVDNSISAQARRVDVRFEWSESDAYVVVLDDGSGMSEPQLIEAMRLGGSGPYAERTASDLGRFGLGLKTASFSQCRRLTVASVREGQMCCARWDLDVMRHGHDGWQLLKGPAPGSEARIAPLLECDTEGTLVLWERLRTGDEGSIGRFMEAIERVERHLAMVFQRLIDESKGSLRMYVNGRELVPWDPFLITHPSTQPRPEARFGNIVVKGFVLPHRDRFANETEFDSAGGPDGWISQQGFYVYRAKRLLVAGGWLGLGGSRAWLKDEASQLARIRIDIPNSVDAAWRIDVRKATARPPAELRDALVRIALDIRRAARDVYSHRVSGSTGNSGGAATGGLWKGTRSMKFPYGIKRDHPAVVAAMDASSEPAALDALLLAIERSVPLGQSFVVAQETPAEYDESIRAARALLKSYRTLGLERAEAIRQVSSTSPFDSIPDLEKLLR